MFLLDRRRQHPGEFWMMPQDRGELERLWKLWRQIIIVKILTLT